ncbi:hypothetical protein [Actinomycetospora straminea]|uniref:hypothetical protein n=1 Tax=Actinomycetospora straminea TaxID=663607 RepID=UPI0023669408|nr:hypothetical protein [Actinomycetospora straminea]MDD7934907.1 hypothetical protein [Actinomycetospora straminea]
MLLALAIGAGVALWLILVANPVGAHGDGADAGADAAPAAVETVGPATVVATASCTGADPRDTVAVDGPSGRRLMPLDGCGTPMGSHLTVRMAFVGTEPADAPARVLGTGSSAALVDPDPAESPLTDRLAILLTGVAGLGMAGLLVAVVRERSRRAATAPARRITSPARRVTTTANGPATPRPAARRTAHRPAARPGRSGRAGRPAALDVGRRQPSARTTPRGAGRSTARPRTRGTAAGPRRPASGPHRD